MVEILIGFDENKYCEEKVFTQQIVDDYNVNKYCSFTVTTVLALIIMV